MVTFDRVRELIEAAEPDMTVVGCVCAEPFACAVGIALWQEYRKRNLDRLKVPPTDGRGINNPELLPYFKHVDRCDDCNEVDHLSPPVG